ncbi:SEC14-like protein 2 [Stegodyphus dumicola]|uniref:SEC14-like protein 2 n=1 Tax=Stegodyphus dumicola TaxID=202533 RepID=UPI0015A9BFCF|nr:SEC14-like protein 2 [Stegodyphus dumicola]XP_035217163.1 SEC14-like protein 2 [Stegodyphus dumicola]XP_035217164.1 SEC14-like protein 2 [Stegodyphus dumicola]
MNMYETKKMSPEEEECIQELRKRFENEMKPEYFNDDSLFLRFLRARNCNLNKAEDMLRNHIEWREKNDIDDIEMYKPPEVAKYFPMSLIGFDKTGSPIRYLPFGNMDAKGLLKSAKKHDCVKSVVQRLESDAVRMKEKSKKMGQNIDQWIYIFDFENYTFAKATHKPTLQMLAYLMMTYEAHYPERLKLAFVVNASVYFTLIFSVVKPLFTGATLNKIKIFGKDGWKEELLKLIDPEVLPVSLGGTRTDSDGDPRCSATINQGGPVPASYYFRSNTRRLCYQPGVKKLNVSRMSKVNVVLDVDEPGSLIEWEFETENKDIGFGLYFQSLDSLQNKPKELIPKQRVEAHVACETGMYQCEVPGTYILMFDNTYSWLQQKEIFCRAVVVRPTGEKIPVLQ